MKYLTLLISIISLLTASLPARAAIDFPADTPLSSGRWVKVKVDSTGVHRIPYSLLRSWGFSRPEKVGVHGYGSVEMSLEFPIHPVTLPAVQVMHSADALYFYGEGETRFEIETANSLSVKTNRYSRGSYYFLSEDTPAAEMEVIPYTELPDATPVETHTAVAACYPREFNPATGGAWWYSRNITDADPYSVTFPLPGFAANGYMGYKAVGHHTEVNYMEPKVKASEGVEFTPVATNRIYRTTNEKEVYRYMSKYNVAPFKPADGTGEVTFTLTPDHDTDVTLLCLDNMWITYSRRNELTTPASHLSMNFAPGVSGVATIAAPSPDVVVWDVTDVRRVVSLSTITADDGTVMFNIPEGEATRQIEAFYPTSDLPVPAYAGEVNSSDLHALTGDCDMLIISAPNFLPAARRLAEAHASRQGLEVTVADKTAVLNEFGSGSFTPNAVRLFVKMLHDRGNRLKYVLLIGAGFYDNASVASDHNIYLPTYQAELQSNAYNIAKAYTSDSFFGYVEDEISPDICTRVDNVTPRTIDIAVGRFPTFSVAEAELLVDKAIAYLDDPVLAGDPALVMIMADKGNENQHALGSEDVATEILARFPGLTVSRCYDAAYKNTSGGKNSTLIKHIRAGFASNPSLITYAGHSSRGSLFSDAFVTRPFFDELQYGSAPLFLSASCHPYMLDYEYRGLVSDLLLRPEGGSTFIIGPAREVYLKNNQVFCDEFARRYFDMANRTIGDVYRATMSAMQEEGQSVRTNALSYNLGGDPALPLPRIDAQVTLDSEGTVKLVPGRRTRLSGSVTDADGNLCTDFSGTLNIKVFDVPAVFQSFANTSDDNEDRFTIKLDDTVLAEVDCRVTAGKWETYITMPAVANENGSNRLVMSARRDEGFSMAVGYTTDVTIAAYDPTQVTPDEEAPVIEITVDDALADGSRVETSRTPRFLISVTDGDGSGINMNRSSVGSAMSVILDNHNSIANIDRALRPDGEGGYSVIFSPQTLNDGRHSLTVKVADNAGNTATRTLDFYVVEEAFDCSLAMESDIVKSPVTFTIYHPLSDAPDARIVIEDLHGRHIISRTVKGDTFYWDLRDDSGKPVADGSYRAYAVVSSHPRYSSTKPLKFTVIR